LEKSLLKIKRLERQLQSALPAPRYAHTLSVARLAAAWAQRWGVPPQRAYLAGLLHDCARGLSWERQALLLRRYRGRYYQAAMKAFPQLWHNPAGVYLAWHRYGIRDSGVLRAVALHSTGAPRMHPLDQIIFVADYCEPLRKFREAARLRALAERGLAAAVRAVALGKYRYLKKAGAAVHPNLLALLARVNQGKSKLGKSSTLGRLAG
jgi:predicted HD superfamily hydrolase involved in NAD metabolism